ncbi:hypothetical protein C7974DRAFT_426876 [Boeremia exigua]|uniref:uncharacterized protein n=1 Tax=Boeremia exigua TaxID=749465 RepID=UPI001E8E05E2|nr:uncharacterized protein C7974DRAFT_426876 [Boeremia exigua]KAH6618604.1 hypothetical protein C7974DRAFT_426876 [Boeremia exigua]
MSSEVDLVHYITVTREIDAPIGEVWGLVAGFGAEKAWYPDAKSVSLTGFGVGSIRTFHFAYPAGPNKGEEYIFSEDQELTECDAPNYSLTFRVRRPDYPDMVAFGTTALTSLAPGKTRFDWHAKGSRLPDEYADVLKTDLHGRFNGLITAMAKQLV